MPMNLARFLVSARHMILAVMIALTIGAAFLIPKVGVITDMAEFLPTDSSMRAGIALMEEEFPEDAEISTTRVMTRGLCEEEELATAEALARIPGVAKVQHKAGDPRFHKGEASLFIVESPHPYGSAQDTAIQHAIEEQLAGSEHVLRSDTPSQAGELPLWIVILAVCLVALILFIMCPSWLEPLLFLVTIGMAVVLNLGTNIIRGSIADITFTIGAILQLVLSMDYSIILMNRYRQERENARNTTGAMSRALRGASSSILSSSMTTVVGLLMLCFMSLGIGMDLGIALAKGVFLSMLSVFLILPSLILMFDRWLLASQKPYWEPRLRGLARVQFRFRWPILLVFIALFAGSAFSAAGTPVAYTLSKDDPIAEVFDKDNPIVLVYANEDEDAARGLAQRLEGDPHVSSVSSHSSTIGKQRSLEDMKSALNQMSEESGTQGFTLDDRTLRLVYFLAHEGKASEKMTLAEFVSFVRSDPDASSYMDQSMRDRLDALTPFLDREALLAPQGAAGLASLLKMSEEDARAILLAHAISDPSISADPMSLAQFIDFVAEDLAQDPQYSSMVTGAQITRLRSVERFTDAEAMTRPIGYSQMARLLGMDEELLAQVYATRVASGGAYDSAKWTFPQHLDALGAVAALPQAAAGLAQNQGAGLDKLAKIADAAAMMTPMDAASLARITGQSVEEVGMILQLKAAMSQGGTPPGGPQSGSAQSGAQSGTPVPQSPQSSGSHSGASTPPPDTSSLMASPKDYLDFLLAASNDPASPLATMIGAEEKKGLAALHGLITLSISGQAISAADFASLTGIDARTIAFAHALADIPALGGQWAFSPQEIVNALAMEPGAEDRAAELRKLATIINDSVAGRAYTPARLATLTGMSDRDARSIALLRSSLYSDSSAWNMSARDAVTFLVDTMIPSVHNSRRFTSEECEQLRFLRTLIDSVVEPKRYTPEELAAFLTRAPANAAGSGAPERIDPDQISLAYLMHGASGWSPQGRSLSIAQFVSTLSKKILNDPRFDGLLTQEKRAAIAQAEEQIAQATVQLIGHAHSRMIITTSLPEESEQSEAFVSALLATCQTDFQQGCHLIGNSVLIHEMSETFSSEMSLISWLTAVAIFTVIALTFLSPSLPALLVLLVQAGVFITITTIGVQGYSNYYLAQLMVQCILMGATIDYGILLSSQYREARRSLGIREALERALSRSIHTIMTSASIMILVTGILSFLFDNPTVAQICRTISIGALAATTLILFMLPGLLSALDPLIGGRTRLREPARN